MMTKRQVEYIIRLLEEDQRKLIDIRQWESEQYKDAEHMKVEFKEKLKFMKDKRIEETEL